MTRATWEFPYAADELLKAATDKRKTHADKLKWWSEQKTKVVAEIKAGGIEFDDSLAAGTPKFSTSNYNRDTSVTVRADLLRDLNECNSKIRQHHLLFKDYDGWVDLLKTQGSRSVPLSQMDWLYFYGKSSDVLDEEEEMITEAVINEAIEKASG